MVKFSVPLSVPKQQRDNYLKNLKLATRGCGRLFLFAGDQKVEHLNADFYGPGITPEDASPAHLFAIASQIPGAVLAAHVGLLATYGKDYKNLPYILKVNGKSPLSGSQDNLYSGAWLKNDHVIRFQRQSGLKIVGLGYTVYLGSNQEAQMLKEAAEMIHSAHQAGLLAIIWMYPRHPQIKNEDDVHLIAGGAGVAACLGADFVKVKYPYKTANTETKAAAFKEVIRAAGKTRVICVGGGRQKAEDLLKHLFRQLKNGAAGMAIGRNLHQRPLKEAMSLGMAISALIHDNVSLNQALAILKKEPASLKNQKKS
ncbi:MAG TPA: aldolase [bacterium]|jgi:fructose-bisphosphate aldolase/6-deoxy-5-ketofructose 1-phosphate synthase|nr:MAG: Fructose-bisphosphate aldolase class 1 [Parcubacteria group bacterium ADurb.Bin115]HNU81472.1 aldolase [bacterium]HOD86960.1 aldolase [bacterium]HQB76607.1 aldolase [bacterium]HQL34615.1 aldolase [bacterium]